MEFWRCNMPSGMRLRSPKFASSIASPHPGLRVDDYAVSKRLQIGDALRLEDFIAYGRWFQHAAVPHVDPRRVAQLATGPRGFRLTLQDGERLEAEYVVVAAGISPFAYRPSQFNHLPAALVSHSSEHADLGKFAGLRIGVVGAGQSAFESAALLLENGAEVEIIVRAAKVYWIVPGFGSVHRLRRLKAALYPPTAVGPIGWHFPPANHIVARPQLLRILPQRLQQGIHDASIRPAVSDWVRPRLAGARITTSRNITSAAEGKDGVHLTLDDGSERYVDHVLLGTGYRVDISQYDFISPDLLHLITRVRGYPQLTSDFRSSIRRLFFVGAVAAHNFGPLLRFVSGTDYCAKTVARAIISEIATPTNRRVCEAHLATHAP